MERLIMHGNRYSFVQCGVCKDFYFRRNSSDIARFCKCHPLNTKQSQGDSKSLIYVAINEDGLIKVGLSRQGKTLKHRFYAINRSAKKADISQFKVKHVFIYDSRSLAHSTERVIHSKIKDIPGVSNLGNLVTGGNEIYNGLIAIKVLEIIENVNSFVKKYMSDS